MNERRFPLTSQYNEQWIRENAIFPDTLYYTESLCNILPIGKDMRILELGCGKAVSPVFIAREFGAQVWAVDREVSPTENSRIIREMDVAGKVFPMKCEAKSLPFARAFFDMVISIDAFSYYGTDDWYIPYLAQFVKKGGHLAISEWCFKKEFKNISEVPDYMKACYQNMVFTACIPWNGGQTIWKKPGLFR